MSRSLLDTDILSEILKGRDAHVARNAAEYLASHGEFTVTAVSVMEIGYGLLRARRDTEWKAFKTAIETTCRVLAFDSQAAFIAGQIEADLEKIGTPIDSADVMIAAISLIASIPIVTGNTAHFRAVAKAGWPIAIENWRAA